jgi:hypothetical protein
MVGIFEHNLSVRSLGATLWRLATPLHVRDDLAGVALKPAPDQFLGYAAVVDDQIAGEILGLDLASASRAKAAAGVAIATLRCAWRRACAAKMPVFCKRPMTA